MTADYGKKVTMALHAVRRLHSDTSKLLVDCDKKRYAEGCYSVFENVATRDLTYNVNAEYWMAQAVYRYYANDAKPGLVEALTVCFFDERIDEPILLTAQFQYQVAANELVKDLCAAWDAWDLFFEPPGERKPLGKVHICRKFPRQTLQWGKVLAAPLYSIQRIEDVEQMVQEVRQAAA